MYSFVIRHYRIQYRSRDYFWKFLVWFYTLLIPVYQRLLHKPSKNPNIRVSAQCVTVLNVPKCMSSHKGIVMITGRHIAFMITYILSTLLLWDLSTLCVIDHLWSLILRSLLSLLSTPLIHWYQQHVTLHYVPWCMCCYLPTYLPTYLPIYDLYDIYSIVSEIYCFV